MPSAQVNCALQIDSLKCVDLDLVTIGHNDHGLNRWAGIPDPSEEKAIVAVVPFDASIQATGMPK